MCYTHIVTRLEIMYDDYDLDYTYTNDYESDLDAYDLDYTYTNDHTDLDEYYASRLDLDEDYARDSHDYESLAYRHYA